MSAEENKRSSKAVLITGAAGYIGSLLTRSLVADPGDLELIVATDIRDTAPDFGEPPGNGHATTRLLYLPLDVRSNELGQVMAEHKIDTVIHLAAIVSPRATDTRQFLYSVEVEGTRNVLEACVQNGVDKLVITSSGAAYGYHPENAWYLNEDAPLRGNEEFAYSHHKRLVEQMLAQYRGSHPELSQLVFRVGTILGETAQNQITALFHKPAILGLRGVATPFVFIWDQDVVGCLRAGIFGQGAGTYNLAGDGALTLREIATRLGKPYVTLPTGVVSGALGVLQRLKLSRYGPEQVGFLQYRPVLDNRRLKREFGYRPRYSSREVFELYRHKNT